MISHWLSRRKLPPLTPALIYQQENDYIATTWTGYSPRCNGIRNLDSRWAVLSTLWAGLLLGTTGWLWVVTSKNWPAQAYWCFQGSPKFLCSQFWQLHISLQLHRLLEYLKLGPDFWILLLHWDTSDIVTWNTISKLKNNQSKEHHKGE